MPLYPIPLHPAYRHGSATPWGGDGLRRAFGKAIPDEHTGESLEMSVIPGLESTDDQGRTLADLLRRDWRRMAGSEIPEGTFPLLLKLIDARERLSVQVHPDNEYARVHENKQGKTEAWVILEAKPGAQLVYGIKPGINKAQLRQAAETGSALETLLQFVPVKAGDVFFIPAGMVHAIGGGILLYEIQQSSDITYRFFDWNRTDASGRQRPLHIRQALDVVRLDLPPQAVSPVQLSDAHCRREMLLDRDYFTLQRLSDCAALPFHAEKTHFSVLTVLSEGKLTIHAGEGERLLSPGTSVFIPADCTDFSLDCSQCLLAAPSNKRAGSA